MEDFTMVDSGDWISGHFPAMAQLPFKQWEERIMNKEFAIKRLIERIVMKIYGSVHSKYDKI